MILSTSSFRFVLLSSLAVSAMSNSIRGKNIQDSHLDDQQRNLVQIDMSITNGNMVCQEDSFDGSVVCTFRTTKPANLNTGTLVYDCLYGNQNNYCLSTEVRLIPFNEVPANAQVVDATPTNPIETCPARQPNTGMGCAQSVPNGQTEAVCLYGQMRCECTLDPNPAIAEAWDCRLVQPTTLPETPPITTLPETPPVTTLPETPGVDADIFNVGVGSPTPSPVNINNGQILPQIVNAASCPIGRPQEGDGCTYQDQCVYYVMQNNVRVGAEDCLCGKEGGFVCRPSRNPAFSF